MLFFCCPPVPPDGDQYPQPLHFDEVQAFPPPLYCTSCLHCPHANSPFFPSPKSILCGLFFFSSPFTLGLPCTLFPVRCCFCNVDSPRIDPTFWEVEASERSHLRFVAPQYSRKVSETRVRNLGSPPWEGIIFSCFVGDESMRPSHEVPLPFPPLKPHTLPGSLLAVFDPPQKFGLTKWIQWRGSTSFSVSIVEVFSFLEGTSFVPSGRGPTFHLLLGTPQTMGSCLSCFQIPLWDHGGYVLVTLLCFPTPPYSFSPCQWAVFFAASSFIFSSLVVL